MSVVLRKIRKSRLICFPGCDFHQHNPHMRILHAVLWLALCYTDTSWSEDIECRVIASHIAEVSDIKFSQSGKLIAIGLIDDLAASKSTMDVRRIDSGELIHSKAINNASLLTDLRFSFNDIQIGGIASDWNNDGSFMQRIVVLDTTSGECHVIWNGVPWQRCFFAGFEMDGHLLAIVPKVKTKGFDLVDLNSKQLLSTSTMHCEWDFASTTMSTQGKAFVFAPDTLGPAQISVIDTVSLRILHQLPSPKSGIRWMQVSDTGNTLIVGCRNGIAEIHFLDKKDSKLTLALPQGEVDHVFTGDISGDGKMIAIVGGEWVAIYDTANGSDVLSIRGNYGAPLSFSNDGNQLAVVRTRADKLAEIVVIAVEK